MMAKIVLRELMDSLTFMEFKTFLNKGNDPSCLRECLLPILSRNSASGNVGLQILDRNSGAGWNLLSLLLAPKPSDRISCLGALRHPFLCGPRWRIDPSIDIIKWGLGSTAVRITEEYIYGHSQRSRLAYFIELMEMLNPNPYPKDWLELLPGRWRLLYSTGRHIGLTLRQTNPSVLIGNAFLTFSQLDAPGNMLKLFSHIGFTVISGPEWPHSKVGVAGRLCISSVIRLSGGSRHYVKKETETQKNRLQRSNSQELFAQKLLGRRWSRSSLYKELPSNLPMAKLVADEVDMTMHLDSSALQEVSMAGKVLQEVRTLIPPEMFDVSKIVCGTFIDSRLLVVRSATGSALLFTRSC